MNNKISKLVASMVLDEEFIFSISECTCEKDNELCGHYFIYDDDKTEVFLK